MNEYESPVTLKAVGFETWGDKVVTVPSSISHRTYGACVIIEIGDLVFLRDAKMEELILPNTITKIGKSAIAYNPELKKVVLPEYLETIGERAFEYNTKLESLTLPENITSIPYELCNGCSALSEITIPEGVTEIGYHAFFHQTPMVIRMKSPTPPTLDQQVFPTNSMIYVPKGSLESYKTAASWQYSIKTGKITLVEDEKATSSIISTSPSIPHISIKDGQIHIEASGATNIAITSVSGITLASSSNGTLIKELPAGLYIITIDTQSQKIAVR